MSRADLQEAPPRPAGPYFDTERDAWVLSRYADVMAANREPGLVFTGAKGPEQGQTLRRQMQAALDAGMLAAWRTTVGRTAADMVSELAAQPAVDLVGDFARPWCLRLAVLVTGVDPVEAEELASLSRHVSAAAAQPGNEALRAAAERANEELAAHFGGRPAPQDAPTFVALSQTLVCLLAKCWHALLTHPAELSRLRRDRSLLPNAIEELLRYAGFVEEVSRRAASDVMLGDAMILKGQKVVLQLAAANRDAAQFPDPDRLDIGRVGVGHLTLGGGPHNCAGGPMIRMAAEVATAAWLDRFQPEPGVEPEWRGGPVFRWPVSLRGVMRS